MIKKRYILSHFGIFSNRYVLNAGLGGAGSPSIEPENQEGVGGEVRDTSSRMNSRNKCQEMYAQMRGLSVSLFSLKSGEFLKIEQAEGGDQSGACSTSMRLLMQARQEPDRVRAASEREITPTIFPGSSLWTKRR